MSFRHFVLMRKFEVQTDNSALSQIFKSKDLSNLYARWYHKLAEFEGITINHRPGRKLYCADALLRRWKVEGDDARPFYVEKGVLYKLKGGSQGQQRYKAAGNEEGHAHTYTRAHAHTHARAHTHTCTHTYTCACTCANTRRSKHMSARTQKLK